MDMTLTSVKGGLVVTSQSEDYHSEMVFYNTTQFARKRHDLNPIFDEVESEQIREGVLKLSNHIDWNLISEVRVSTSNSLLLVRSLQDDQSVILYEVKQPFLLKQTKSFLEDAATSLQKMPMMVIALGGVAIY